MSATTQIIDAARLASIADYAKEKEVTKQTVYNWIATGAVKGHKVGKLLLVVRP